jgi:hypothetical protein
VTPTELIANDIEMILSMTAARKTPAEITAATKRPHHLTWEYLKADKATKSRLCSALSSAAMQDESEAFARIQKALDERDGTTRTKIAIQAQRSRARDARRLVVQMMRRSLPDGRAVQPVYKSEAKIRRERKEAALDAALQAAQAPATPAAPKARPRAQAPASSQQSPMALPPLAQKLEAEITKLRGALAGSNMIERTYARLRLDEIATLQKTA